MTHAQTVFETAAELETTVFYLIGGGGDTVRHRVQIPTETERGIAIGSET